MKWIITSCMVVALATGSRVSRALAEHSTGDPIADATTVGPRLGLQLIGLTPDLRSFYGAPPDRGVLVAAVEAHSAADRAKLRVGDVLVSVQGRAIESAGDASEALSRHAEGQPVALAIVRDHELITTQAIVARLSARAASPATSCTAGCACPRSVGAEPTPV
jgi:S1-C subfamily serine protease